MRREQTGYVYSGLWGFNRNRRVHNKLTHTYNINAKSHVFRFVLSVPRWEGKGHSALLPPEHSELNMLTASGFSFVGP